MVFELELDIVEHRDGRVTGAFSYANELVDARFATTLAQEYIDTVKRFVDAPNAPLDAPCARPEHAGDTRCVRPADAPDADSLSIANTLLHLWRDLFNAQPVSRDDNLFEAGATSFDVVRFIDATRAAGFELTIRDVFEAPSMTGLAMRIASNVALREP